MAAAVAEAQSASDATGSSSAPIIDGSRWSGVGNVNFHRNCADLRANLCYIILGCRDTAARYGQNDCYRAPAVISSMVCDGGNEIGAV